MKKSILKIFALIFVLALAVGCSKPSEKPIDSNEVAENETEKPKVEDTKKTEGDDIDESSEDDTIEPAEDDTKKPLDDDAQKPDGDETDKPSGNDTEVATEGTTDVLEILNKSKEAMSKVKSLSYDTLSTTKYDIEVSGQNMANNSVVKSHVETDENNVSKVDYEIINTYGEEEVKASSIGYSEVKDGKSISYTQGQDGNWSKFEYQTEKKESALVDYTVFAKYLTLDSESDSNNYILTGEIDLSDFQQNEENFKELSSLYIKSNVTLLISKKDFMITKNIIDTAKFLESSLAELGVKNVQQSDTVTSNYKYNQVKPITIPQEALNAEIQDFSTGLDLNSGE